MIAEPTDAGVGWRRLIALVPLAVFFALAVLFLLRLNDTTDRSNVPSVLIGRPAPVTPLPPLEGLTRDAKPVPGITPETFAGKVTLVNVWGSWCVPCRDEAPLLMQVSKDSRIQIVGINYKDRAEDARGFLNTYGNPFVAIGTDVSGRAGIEWGVYGVPETFVIGRDGRISFKLIGPITPDNVRTVLKREVEKALAEP